MIALLRMALRNLTRNRRRTGVTLAALVLGVAAVIVLRGLSDGFVQMTLREVVLARTGAIQIHRAGYFDALGALPTHLHLQHDDAFQARLRAVPGVRAVAGRITFSGLITDGRSQTSFVGRGIDPVREREALPGFGADLLPGSTVPPAAELGAILLGKELAGSFGIEQVDDSRTLTVSSQSASGRANALHVRSTGLLASALPFESKRVAVGPLVLAQQLVGLEGRVTSYVVAVDRLDAADQIAARLQTALGVEYEVRTWEQLEPYLHESLRRQRVVLGVLVGILFVLALLVVANTLVMTVLERVREIGTLLALGMRRRQIVQLFLFEAAALGGLGGVVGAVLGVAIVHLSGRTGIPLTMFDRVVQLRPEVHPGFVALAAIGAALAALVAALWPAWRAARLDPSTALSAVRQ
jgi:putative ABC transport system permease protein